MVSSTFTKVRRVRRGGRARSKVSNFEQTNAPLVPQTGIMVNLPRAAVGHAIASDRMRAPSCQECTQLLIDYSAAVFEHVKLEGRLKLAAMRYEAGQYRPAAHATEVAADKRAAAQKKMKEHKALHGGLVAEAARD